MLLLDFCFIQGVRERERDTVRKKERQIDGEIKKQKENRLCSLFFFCLERYVGKINTHGWV